VKKNTSPLQQICPLVDRMSNSFYLTICLTERADLMLSTTLITFLLKKNTSPLKQICPLVGRMSYNFY
jgi:hypothetical protein